jgi:cephalosporin hydroxylase
MNEIEKFNKEKEVNIENLGRDQAPRDSAMQFMLSSSQHQYTYNFTWMGRPIIQYPQDIMALQEIIWSVKPDLIIETGIAHGGSLIFSASMLELIGGNGKVVGIDIDIRKHNRDEIEKHPMFKRIHLVEGSSVDRKTVEEVKGIAASYKNTMVILDSNHTHEHVLQELHHYAPLVSVGSYLCVFDTLVEDIPAEYIKDRPWGKGNNPKTAVWEFLKDHDNFEIDKSIENKLLITVAPDGYLKRTR